VGLLSRGGSERSPIIHDFPDLVSSQSRRPRARSVVVLAVIAVLCFVGHAVPGGLIFVAAAFWRGTYIYRWHEQTKQRQAEELERRRVTELQEQKRKEEVAITRGPKPIPSLIRTYRDAEEAAALWMRWLGWGDAHVTPQGRDGGIDVMSTHAVAQVKAHVNPIGRPQVQQLFGVASSMKRTPLFFASAGYTPEAITWADQVSMALFRFDLQGEPEPSNHIARRLWENGAFPPFESKHP
jgi:hypothetical protein